MQLLSKNISQKPGMIFKLLSAWLMVLTILSGFYLVGSLTDGSNIALAATEPSCQSVSTTPLFNGYANNLNSNNPTFEPNNCQDLPMLSFFPINTTANNPRELTISQNQTFSIQVYYNNSANPTAGAINNPNLGVRVVRETDTRYRISATLSGSNVPSLTSAQDGGDLIVNVPSGQILKLNGDTTNHFIDAIERKEEADNTGRTPFDRIADNSTAGNISNPIYTEFTGTNLGSSTGFAIKPSLEAGFLGYGYVLSQISAVDAPVNNPTNQPPSIPGQTISVVRGQSGSFTALNPTDPNNDIPISLNLSQIPNFCVLTGTANNTGGGQIITCNPTSTNPTSNRVEFDIIPTDSRGLVGTAGRFVVNILEANTPSLSASKTCVKRGTNTDCDQADLGIGDQITYRIRVRNTGNTNITNLVITDTFDAVRLNNLTAISNNGILSSSNGTITWTSGSLATGQEITVSFEATIRDVVESGDDIVNTAIIRADNLPDTRVSVDFDIVGAIKITKRCFAGLSGNTDCQSATLRPGDEVRYELKIENTGSSVARNVKVIDNYDRNLTSIDNISDGGRLDTNNRKISWDLDNLDAGEEKTLTYRARISNSVFAGTIIRNAAVVTADNLPDDKDEFEFEVDDFLGSSNLSISKSCLKLGTSTTCSSANLLPADSVTYTITVTNTGSARATNVRVVDTYDQNNLNNIRNINPSGTNANGQITWTLPILSPGSSATFSFNATINNNVADNTNINNLASVRADGVGERNTNVNFVVDIPTPPVPPRTGGLNIAGSAATFVGILIAIIIAYLVKTSKNSRNLIPARISEQKIV